MSIVRKQAQWRSYKPQKDGNGAASKLEMKISTSKVTKDNKSYDRRNVEVFWVSAMEEGKDANGNAKFTWADAAKSVTLKLGEADIGELLAVLNGAKVQVGGDKGIFHQNDKGNTSFSFAFNSQYKNYGVRLGKKVGTQLVSVKHTITIGEAQVLKVLLEQAVKQIYEW